MNGLLVVNGFLNSNKFNEIYLWLKNAFERRGHSISVYTNAELSLSIPDNKDIDFVIFWDKDIMLAKQLESRGMRLFNSSEAIEICDNKALTYIALKGRIPMPKTIVCPMTYRNIGYTRTDFVKKSTEILGLPVVIKECYGSFGEQVYLAETEEQAEEIVKNTAEPLIFQEYIKESSGRDIRLNVTGGRVVASMLRYNSNDFRANITNGGSMEKYTPTEEETAVAQKACKEIGLDFGGVDILFSERGPLLCEVNSNAHFRNIYDCTGINAADSICEYIEKSVNSDRQH